MTGYNNINCTLVQGQEPQVKFCRTLYGCAGLLSGDDRGEKDLDKIFPKLWVLRGTTIRCYVGVVVEEREGTGSSIPEMGFMSLGTFYHSRHFFNLF